MVFVEQIDLDKDICRRANWVLLHLPDSRVINAGKIG